MSCSNGTDLDGHAIGNILLTAWGPLVTSPELLEQWVIGVRDGQQLQQALLDDTCLRLVPVLAKQARDLGVSRQPHVVELNMQRAWPARDDQASAKYCATIELGNGVGVLLSFAR